MVGENGGRAGAQAAREGALPALNAMLFREMERLEAADGEALAAEIGRARALREAAATVIDNGRLMLAASREMEAAGEAVQVPRGLLRG